MYWSGLQTVASQVVSCATFFLLARILDPKDYGLVAYSNLFILFTTTITEGGMGRALTQRHELEPLHIHSVFWDKMTLGLIATVLGVALAPLIASCFHMPEITNILRIVSLSFLIYPWIWVQTALLQREFKFKSLAARTLIANILSGIIGVSCAFLGFKAWSLVIQQLSVLVISAIIMFQLSPWRPAWQFSLGHLRNLLGFGTAMAASGLLSFCANRLPYLIIGYWFGAVALGYFNVAGRFAELVRDLFYVTTIPVIFSAFSRLQKDRPHLLKQFYRSVRLLAAVTLPAFVGLSLLSGPLIHLVIGPKWMFSALLVPYLALTGILECISSLNATLLQATGRAGQVLKFGAISAAWMATFLLLGVSLGLVGFTLFRTICGYLLFGISLYLIKKLAGVYTIAYMKCLVAPIVSVLIMAGVVLLLEYGPLGGTASWVTLIFLSLAGALTYGAALLLFSHSILIEIWEIILLVLRKKQAGAETPL